MVNAGKKNALNWKLRVENWEGVYLHFALVPWSESHKHFHSPITFCLKGCALLKLKMESWKLRVRLSRLSELCSSALSPWSESHKHFHSPITFCLKGCAQLNWKWRIESWEWVYLDFAAFALNWIENGELKVESAFNSTSRPLLLRVVTLKRKSRAFSFTNHFLLEGLRPIELKIESGELRGK